MIKVNLGYYESNKKINLKEYGINKEIILTNNAHFFFQMCVNNIIDLLNVFKKKDCILY